MAKSFNNKVSAITGAGSGIGQALALNLAQRGCDLALVDINEAGLDETVELIKLYPVKVTKQVLDVSDKQAVFGWADQVITDHESVNYIFNNAGVALSGTVESTTIEDYEWIMGINFWGVIYGTKAFLPYLEKSGDGHVVNTSSISGITSQPLMSGYNASKFGVRGFTEALRQDLEITNSCVTTTCIHPGGIKTNIAKSSRMNQSVTEVTGADREETIKEFEKLFIHTADTAAKVILKGVSKNKRRVLIGADARFFDFMARVFPAKYQWLFAKIVKWRANSIQNK